jgi:hypothetical protein
MRRAPRFRSMEGPTQSLLIIGVCGAVAAAAFGAVAGAGLRVQPRADDTDRPGVMASGEDIFMASAPAYPSWAPEPLYPRAEPDGVARFAAAWDAAMVDAPLRQPVAFGPPPDLPPAYEVRLEGEARPIEMHPAPPTSRPAPHEPPPYEAPRPARQDDKAAY